MKGKMLQCTIIAALALAVGACAPKEASTGGLPGQEEAPQAFETPGTGQDAGAAKEAHRPGAAGKASSRGESEKPPEAQPTEESAKRVFVGIKAHIKEINGSRLLISSDTEDYPGAFTVEAENALAQAGELQGGTFIYILMQDLDGKDEQGLKKYRAERILPLSGDEAAAKEDLLLTEVPALRLQDALSSGNDFAELRSGNYSWNVEEGGEGSGVIACGAAPLEEAAMEFTVRLKVPEYRGIDGAPYCFSTGIAPDILTVRRWDAAQIGNASAPEEQVVTYYYPSPILELQSGKVYEFSAQWKAENGDKNGFYGNAGYVLVTE